MARTPDERDSEARGEERRRVLLGGKLIYGDPPLSLDCAVADLSRSGARIRLEGPEPLKNPIYLVVIRQGLAFLAKEESIFCEAASSASVAGLLKNGVPEGSTVVCVLTGHGLKDPDLAIKAISVPTVIDLDLRTVLSEISL